MILVLSALQHALIAVAGTAFALILVRRYAFAKWEDLSLIFADDPTPFLSVVGLACFLLAVLLAVVV